MGTGGVAEWRGWTFTTDEFWTSARRDQSRESNIRARNVFAVADGDEWYGKSVTGTFDSTLVSPAYPVTGGRTATLTYTAYHRHESPQKGEVLVSCDGAAPVSVRTYTADVSPPAPRPSPSRCPPVPARPASASASASATAAATTGTG
ncbi:hypothetical protein AB0896_00800 [Streptomyces parvulus]|uniref:hypothetical protein n=1 Tax=Streptomyces parvulus TaxID=146923 RepID=UPI003455AA5D